MANNPYVNKVKYGNQTVMDISDTTAEESDVAEGEVFYKGSGERSVGTGSYYSPNDDPEIDIADGDYFPFYDDSASEKKNTLWSNIKAKLKTFFDALYQAKLTFDEYPKRASENPVKSKGIYSSVEGAETLVNDTLGYVKKNIFHIPDTVESQTISGISFTVRRNSEGECTGIAVDGTATADINFNLSGLMSYSLPGGSFIISGCPAGGSLDKYYIRINKDGMYNYYDTGEGCVINSNTYETASVMIYIVIKNGTVMDTGTMNQITFYPMIRKAEIRTDKFFPYTNKVSGYNPGDTLETDLQDNDNVPFYDTSARGKRNTTWSNIKSVLQTFFSNLFVAKSGDTIAGTLQRDIAGGSSTTYIAGCGGASGLHINKAEGDIYYTAVSTRTKTGGGWAIGNYNSDNLLFVFGEKANIVSQTNNVKIVQLRPVAGTIALASEIPSTYAGSDSAGGKATSAATSDIAIHVKYEAGNEINFSGGAQTTCWFNYRNADTGSSSAVSAMRYKFANYSNDTSKTTLEAASFTGNAATASAVKDSGNGNSTTFAYSAAGLAYGDYTWLAGWNGYQLRAVAKSQFQINLGLQLVFNGSLAAGASKAIGSYGAHTIFIVAFGTWNASQLIAVFPNNSSTPVSRLIAGYSTSFQYINITANGQWGITIKNTSSVYMPLMIFAIPKTT